MSTASEAGVNLPLNVRRASRGTHLQVLGILYNQESHIIFLRIFGFAVHGIFGISAFLIENRRDSSYPISAYVV